MKSHTITRKRQNELLFEIKVDLWQRKGQTKYKSEIAVKLDISFEKFPLKDFLLYCFCHHIDIVNEKNTKMCFK